MIANPEGTVDLLVVGGGINGAGIACDAAGRGLRVALCEQDDLASATFPPCLCCASHLHQQTN